MTSPRVVIHLSYHEHPHCPDFRGREGSLGALRAQAEGITTGALVRRMIREKTFVTSEDLLAEMQASTGDKRLAIKKRA